MTSENPSLAANERVSRRFFDMSLELIRQFEAEEDQQAIDTLPTVMITTGVMALCRTLPGDTVAAILEALRLKVERGDFTSPRGLEEDLPPESGRG